MARLARIAALARVAARAALARGAARAALARSAARAARARGAAGTCIAARAALAGVALPRRAALARGAAVAALPARAARAGGIRFGIRHVEVGPAGLADRGRLFGDERGGTTRRDDADPRAGVGGVDDPRVVPVAKLGGCGAGVAAAAIAVRLAGLQAERALEAGPALGIGAADGRVDLLVEGDAAGLLGATVGLAVEERAVAAGLRGVAEAIARGRAVGRVGAVVADLGGTTEEHGGSRDQRDERGGTSKRGEASKHEGADPSESERR